MKKIKFKVKHIVITLIVMFLLIPTLLFAAGTAFYNSSSESLRRYSNVFLSLYTRFPTPAFLNGEAYFKLGENTFNLARNRIFIRSDAYSYPEEARGRNYLSKAIEYYKKGMESGENNRYYTLNYNRAIALYTLAGERKSVESLIDEGLKSKNEKVRLNAARNQIAFDIKNQRYSEAFDKCNSYLEIWKDDYKLHMFRGDLYFLLGDIEGARPDYVEGREPVKLDTKREGSYIDYPSGDRESLVFNRKSNDGSGIIKGRVINGDKPISYAFIALEREDSGVNGDTMNLSGSNSAGFSFTDEQGFYEIRNVPEGRYFLRLVVPVIAVENVTMVQDSNWYTEVFSSKVTEKNLEFRPNMEILQSGIVEPDGDFIDIEWKPVKEAVKYIVSLEVSDGDNFKKNPGALVTFRYMTVTDNKMRLKLDGGSINSLMFSPSFKDDMSPTIASYIGYVDGREIGFYVSAVDKDGRTISKTSRDTNPVIKGKKVELNTGEKLILDNKLVEGKEWFENELRKNSENKNTLYNLIRIYSFGINGEYKDLEKAKEYAERIYRINGDKYEYERIINIIMKKLN
jgi:hypothetical protein